ncbi:lysosomal thioesterase PPT2-A-like isoform X4 [Mobula birostris]|uniref:lysosomal thioesterase PPT2-A-like isoform X4 n=1 Tax=Mobula birostris TaxID=1983395 RepID=UPI003B283456
MFPRLLLAASVAIVLQVTRSYKPVIVVHGLFDSPGDLLTLQAYINQSHPGTNVTIIDLFDRTQSLKSLWSQVEGFKQAISPIMQNAANGVHMICYSQGGLICRGILSTMPDHNVHTLISLSAPLLGQYGDTDYLKWFFPKYVKSNLYHFCYTQLGQCFSICNYWNDPHHHDMYLNFSNYLAVLNNETRNPNATDLPEGHVRAKDAGHEGGHRDVRGPQRAPHRLALQQDCVRPVHRQVAHEILVPAPMSGRSRSPTSKTIWGPPTDVGVTL